MTKYFLIFMLLAAPALAEKPPVDLSKIIVSGVNVAITTPEDIGVGSNMFGYLHKNVEYAIFINSEQDIDHVCYISRIISLTEETPPIDDAFFSEPGVYFTPDQDGVYSVRCYTAPNQMDLIGIVIQKEN